jgi:hypothetical protein
MDTMSEGHAGKQAPLAQPAPPQFWATAPCTPQLSTHTELPPTQVFEA